MQTTAISITPFVLMLYLLHNLKILENILISERYRKTAMRGNWSKFEAMTMSTDIISDTENTLHSLYSLHVPRLCTYYRKPSLSGFPSSYVYKLHMSTLNFQVAFPFLRIFVSFYHCLIFVFRLTFTFCPLDFSLFLF